MIETVLGFIIFGILIFLVIKAIGNIFKGIVLILAAFIIYYLFSSSLQTLTSSPKPIGNFLRASIDKLKSIFYNIDIVTASRSKEGSVIVVRNTGILPLSDFVVKIDGNDVRIIKGPNFLFPKQTGVIEVDWKESYRKIEVYTKEAKASYTSPL